MIRLKSVWFRYPRSIDWCIKDITAKIGTGITAITGPNGSGKTTLLRLIAGFYKPQKGYIEVFGKKISSYTDNLGTVIYVPSNPRVFTVGPTVKKDIEKIITSFKSRYNVNEILDLFNLRELANRKIFQLSEGEHRLLALASAIASDAKVILMDEPTVGLDKTFREVLLTVLRKMGEKKIILIATNDLRLASRADDILLIINGKLVTSGKPQEIYYTEEFIRKVGISEIVEFCTYVGLSRIVSPQELAEHLRSLVTKNV